MTIDDLNAAKDTLQRAIYSGVLEVRFADRLVRYQSITEMRQALADLNDAIASANSTCPRSMCNLVQFRG